MYGELPLFLLIYKSRLRLWQVKVSSDSAADSVSAKLVVVKEPARVCQRQCVNRLVLVKESVRHATRLSV